MDFTINTKKSLLLFINRLLSTPN